MSPDEDTLTQEEIDEVRQELRPGVKAEVVRWIKSCGVFGGKPGDIRVMLARLHDILPYEGSAESILVDFNETNYKVVKKAFRRATRLCHPDRYVGADVYTHMKADLVFAALSTAAERFLEAMR